jgi:hypothetical protein
MDRVTAVNGAEQASKSNIDANDLISRSKSIIQSIDDGLHQMSSSSFLKVGDLRGYTMKTDAAEAVTKSMDRRLQQVQAQSVSEGLTSRGGKSKRSERSPIFQQNRSIDKSAEDGEYELPLGSAVMQSAAGLQKQIKAVVSKVSAPLELKESKGKRRTKTPTQQRGSASSKAGSRKTSDCGQRKSSGKVARKRTAAEPNADLQERLKLAHDQFVEASLLDTELRDSDVNQF